MKRNKILSLLILFAVVVCCTTLFFACNTGTQDNEQSLRIFYDWGDGSQPIEKVIKASEVQSTTSALTPPTRDGYEFLGWSLAKDGDLIVFDQNTIINDGVTLYALWQYTKMTLYYDFNDGSAVVEKVIDKSNVKGASEEMAPANREGYDFVGWALQEKGDVIDFDNAPNISDGATLYAQWQIKTYSVLFMADDFTTIDRQTIEHGGKAEAPSLDKITPYIPQGQSFVGWQFKSGDTFDLDNPITARTVVYAIFSDVSYTVKFQNGDVVVKESTGTVGTEIIAPQATEQPKKDGYTFSHWESEDGRKFASGDVYAKNEIYYAIFTLDAPSTPSLSGPESNEIVYGESATVSAQIKNPSKNITYSFVWYMGDKELGKDSSVTLQKLGVGEYTVRCEATASDGTLTSAKSSQIYTFNVKKATLTATIEDINLIYGDKLPEITPNYSGFKYDDSESVVKGSTTPTTTYSESSSVGTTYYATLNTLYADNYDIIGTFGESKTITASITVAQKAISAKESVLLASKTYDGNVFSKQFSNADFDGVLSGHTLTLDVATKSQNAGVYTHDALQKSLTIVDGDGVDVNANYSTTYSAQLTITNADIVYTAPTKLELAYNGTLQSTLTNELKDESGVTYSSAKDGVYATKEPSFKNAGEYTVYYKIERANHNTVEGSYSVNVAKANITISPKAQPNTSYGKESFALAQGSDYYEISGDIYDVLDVTLSTNYSVGMSVGKYDVYATLGEDENGNHNNYNATCNAAREALEVVTATLTVTLDDISVVYHNSIGDLFAVDESGNYKHFTISGLYKNDDVKDVISFAISNGTNTLWNSNQDYDASLFTIGEYELSLMSTTNDNYFVAMQHSTYTVTKRPVTLSVDDKQITYGDNAPTYTFTSADEYALALELNYSCSFTGAGKYDITATLKTSDYANNFDVTSIEKGTLTVGKRAITLKANDTTCTYGNPLSLGDCTYAIVQGSIVNDDTITATFASTYSSDTTQRTYDIDITAIDETSAQNYDATFEKGTLTITNRKITFRYTNLNVAYNNGEPHVFRPIPPDLPPGDRIDSPELLYFKTKSGAERTYSCTPNEPLTDFEIVNPITILKSTILKNDVDVTEFYDFKFDLAVEIAKIEIVHTITDNTYKYDGTAHKATMQLEEGASVSYTHNGNVTAEMPSFTNAGEYKVLYTLTKEGSTSYSGEFTLSISKRQTIINVADATREYGDSNAIADFVPYTISGDEILEADKNAINIQHSFTVDESSSVGEYPFDVTYTENDNYSITVNNGTLTIEPKQVDLHPTENQRYTVKYGTQPTPYEHVRVEDHNTPVILSGAEAYFKVLPKTIPSEYKYNDSVLETVVEVLPDSNGKVNYTVKNNNIYAGCLAIDVTIKVNDSTITYGQHPYYTYTVLKGTILDHDTLDINYTPTIDSIPTVGTHDISAVPKNDYPYAITVQSCGALTVDKATLTATLSGASTITYGDGLPTYTVSKYEGFKLDTENDSIVSGTLSVTSDYLTQKKIGKFAITASGLVADNYNVVFKQFTITVEKAPLTITANPHGAITYGDDLPTDFTYTATGFKFSDTDAILQGKVSFTSNYTKGADVTGPYTFNVANNITLDNYTVSIGNAQSLVVNKATYTEKEVAKALANINFSGTYSPTQKLADFSLAGTSFAWVNSAQVPTCDNTLGYSATYCNDPLNYNTYSVKIKISLAKANPNIHRDDNSNNFIFGTDYTGEEINYKGIIGTQITHDNKDNTTLPFTVTGATIKDGGIYTITYSLEATTNYTEASKNVTFKVKYAYYNNTLYVLEDLGNITNGTITIKDIGGAKVNAFVSSNVTIPSGVTLDIQGHADDTGGAKDPTYGAGVASYVDNNASYILHKLTINNGVTMTVNGTIILRGLLGCSEQVGNQGHTSGLHSQIINNGEMTFNNGSTLAVRGYIKGTGHATYNSGAMVYMPFAIVDFRGGTSTVGAYNSGKIAPFNEFEMPNVQCEQRIYAGSTVTGYCDLYIDSDKAHKTSTAKIYGSSNAILNMSSGYIDKTYIYGGVENGKTTINVFGNISTGSLSMKVTVSVLVASVDTATVFFPVNYRYSINLKSGTATVKSSFKFLPGSSLSVSQGASLSLDTSSNYNAQLIFYKESDWSDTNSGAPRRTYPDGKGDATFTLGGSMTLGGTTSSLNTKYYSGIGGDIIGLNGASISINSNSVVSVTSSEGYGYTEGTSIVNKFNAKYRETASITKTATLVNANGTTVTASKGTTYTYNGSSWA